MRRIRALLAACVLPLTAVAGTSCSGNGEATTQEYPSAGGQAGSDASAGSAGASGTAGQAGTAGQGGTAGQAGAEQGGSAGQAGASGTAGEAGAAGSSTGGTAGTAGSSTGGSAGSDAGPDVPCTTDAQCAAGTSCQIVANAANTALELRCRPLAGGNGNGYPCTDDSQCRSGLCLEWFCSNPCLSSNDCTQSGYCTDSIIQIGSLEGVFNLCVVAPCSSSPDCDPGEVCSEVKYSSDGVDAFCRQKQAAGAPLGGTCQKSSDCVSQLCSGDHQACTEACAADQDCAASAGAICVDYARKGTDTVQACAPGCSTAAECPTGKACSYTRDTPGDRIRFTCRLPWGTDPTGADCSQQVKCATGLCLTNYLNGQFVDAICTQPCVTAADCPAGFTTCTEVQMPTPSGQGTQLIRMCNH